MVTAVSTAWGWEQLLLSLVAPTYAVLWGINPEQPHDMTGLDNHTQTHSQLSWGWSYRTPCFETKLPVLLAELPGPPLPLYHQITADGITPSAATNMETRARLSEQLRGVPS